MTTTPTSLWGGRFQAGPSAELRRLSRSPESYFTLAPYDLTGSKAHARELNRSGVLDDHELRTVIAGIDSLTEEILAGSVQPIAQDEDVHTFLERVLVERLGPVAGKVRAGRSRNDQAANDLRLFLRDHARRVADLLLDLVDALVEQSERYQDVPVPGFTHLQPAQPVVFAHQLLAHAQPLLRDVDRLRDWDRRAAVSPLGAAALAGSTFAVAPAESAAELGYSAIAENSIDAVGSRDVPLEFLFVASLAFVDLSRLCEEITMWCSVQFGWVRLDDAYCTGSSIMPQKKNPDIAELARGRAGRVLGDLMGMMATVKSLPLAYNRDLMGDKFAVLDALESFELALPALTGLVRTFTIDASRMREDATRGFTLATEAADWLAREGVPFNEAHEIAGEMVRHCEAHGIELHEITPDDLATISPHLHPAVLQHLTVDAALAAHGAAGGTAPAQVARQLERARDTTAKLRTWAGEYSGPRFASRSSAQP
jgi:argininosuccinate lyase